MYRIEYIHSLTFICQFCCVIKSIWCTHVCRCNRGWLRTLPSHAVPRLRLRRTPRSLLVFYALPSSWVTPLPLLLYTYIVNLMFICLQAKPIAIKRYCNTVDLNYLFVFMFSSLQSINKTTHVYRRQLQLLHEQPLLIGLQTHQCLLSSTSRDRTARLASPTEQWWRMTKQRKHVVLHARSI